MINRILILSIIVIFPGCAFKNPEESVVGSSVRFEQESFVPRSILDTDLKGLKYGLIDVLKPEAGKYTINQTTQAVGEIYYQYEHPRYEHTPCEGIGYNVEFTRDKQVAGQRIKLVPFVNGNRVLEAIRTIDESESLVIGVYAEVDLISEYYWNNRLPSQFSRDYLPSGRCRFMCTDLAVDPLPGKTVDILKCNHAQVHNKIQFYPWGLGHSDRGSREGTLKQLELCGAVNSNQDLSNYYDQAVQAAREDRCAYGAVKVSLAEYYWVDQKLKFDAPKYSILNFNKIIKSTVAPEYDVLRDRPVLSADQL